MPISVCYFDLASEQTVHLRTPKETSVGKVTESCLRMLGINEDKDHFNLKSKEGFVYIQAKRNKIFTNEYMLSLYMYEDLPYSQKMTPTL